MQIYRKIIINYWCGEKCHFNHACTHAPAEAFRCGGHKVFGSMGGFCSMLVLVHGSVGSRAGAVAVPVLVEGLLCPAPLLPCE